MKRLAVFLIVGPILGACAVLFTSVMLGNKPDLTDPDEWAMGLFAGLLAAAGINPLDHYHNSGWHAATSGLLIR